MLALSQLAIFSFMLILLNLVCCSPELESMKLLPSNKTCISRWGGDRFRVCIEDIIELLVREFCVVSKPDWERLVQEGRDKYERVQAETVIRHNLPLAIDLLVKSGYSVIPPQD